MNRLQADAAESMKKEPAAAMCHRKYTDLAKAAMKYEKRLYGTWVEGADAVALVRLKEPVLRTGRPESGEDAETSGEAKEPSAEDHVVVNFHPELIALLRESRYLDRMGFAIPETTLKVALQEDKFNACRQALYEMLQRYRAAVDRLSEMERSLFSEKLRELRAVLEPGYNPLNWMSLGILEFVETCDFAINEFSSLVNQVQKTAGVVAAAVNDISTASVVVEPPAGDEVLDLLEAMEFFERHRTELCNRLARKYRSIGPLLGKVEEAVAGTNTGKSAQLRGYYQHWEKAIFFALNDLVLNSLDVIARLFDERAPGRRPGRHPCSRSTSFSMRRTLSCNHRRATLPNFSAPSRTTSWTAPTPSRGGWTAPASRRPNNQRETTKPSRSLSNLTWRRTRKWWRLCFA